MRAVSHLALSAAAGALAWRMGLGGAATVLGAAVGGLLPDLDLPAHVSSPLERWTIRLFRRTRAAWAGYLLAALIRLFRLILLALGASHRGWWHSPVIPILLIAVGAVFRGAAGNWVFGTGLGMLVHLLADSLTPTGIRWFRWHLRGPVRTGSPLEAVVVVVALFFALAMMSWAR